MEPKQFRYPGVRPFRTSDRHLFFGRDEDRDKLYNLILLEKMLVLFGKSGYGKSSLLNAAIVPLLTDPQKRTQFIPLEIKFGNYMRGQSKPPLEVFHAKLDEKLHDSSDGSFLKNEGDSLWHRLKCKQSTGSPLRIVLIFDQFEEFFSYPPAWQENLRWQLAELLFTDIPQALRDRFDDLNAAQQDFLSQTMHVKVVFSIRSDRMSHLDSMKDALPTILHKRYELLPLTNKQAEEAIVKPALEGQEQGDWREKFSTPPFEYNRAALDAMLRYSAAGLDHSGEGVEAFLLQILCEHVEDLVKKGSVPDLDGNGLPDVTPAQLPDMQDLLGGYLHRKLSELDPTLCPAACRLLEEGLLAEDLATGIGKRTSVDSQTLLGQFRKEKLTQQVLDDLERNYLVRRERNTVGGYSYELSHDRLVAPVQKMKKERLAAEEKERLKKRQRQLIGIIALVVLVAGGAIAFAVWAFGQKKAAEKAKAETQEALQKADKLVNAFYFYADRFALAYGAKGEYGENVFYFIDKNGDEVTKLGRWEKAEQFEWTGFAKVKKKEDERWTDYLLDTLGNAYPAAFDLKDLNKNITALDLSGKYLYALPDSLFQHTQLKVLLLNSNQLTRLPAEIGQLKSLTELGLNDNQLTSLPTEIGQLQSLTELYLSDNPLTRLPVEIGQLKNLTYLYLSFNRLTSLPEEIGQLKSLFSLDLSGNRLTSLPLEIGQLKSLIFLNLGNNQLTSLPAEIGQLESLTELRLDGNKLTSLPVEIGQLESLTELYMSYNGLTSLPQEIVQLTSLTALGLGGNGLTSLPAEIGQLQNLTELYLWKNQLTNLPAEIGQLKSLGSLDLTQNGLTSLPGEIGQLKSLIGLYFSGNQLTSLPGEIGQLESLTRLDLSDNKLTTLPREIKQLKSLEYLNLGGNPISEAEQEKIRRLLPGCKIVF